MRGARLPAVGNPYLDLQIDRGSTTKDVQALGYLYVPIEINGARGARVEESTALVQWKRRQLELKAGRPSTLPAVTWNRVPRGTVWVRPKGRS